MINPEKEIVAFLNSQFNNPTYQSLRAYIAVPQTRPERFITVERVGGTRTRFIETVSLAVQMWGETRWDASQLVAVIQDAFYKLERLSWCAGVTVGAASYFPDPASRHERYQFTCEVGVMVNSGESIWNPPF